MQRFFSVFILMTALSLGLFASFVQPVQAAEQRWNSTACFYDDAKRGVLIPHAITKVDSSIDTKATVFSCYIAMFLRNNMIYVIILAIILIVTSGIQYMLAGGAPGEAGKPSAAGKAKQRILGVLGGVVFYFLITYLLPLIMSGLSL
jgi:hypothetical protein